MSLAIKYWHQAYYLTNQSGWTRLNQSYQEVFLYGAPIIPTLSSDLVKLPNFIKMHDKPQQFTLDKIVKKISW